MIGTDLRFNISGTLSFGQPPKSSVRQDSTGIATFIYSKPHKVGDAGVGGNS